MRWVVLVLSGFVVGSLDGCFMLRCEETFHGVREGDRFSTTVIGPYSRPSSGDTSCGSLGDLMEGTTFRWTARPDGPGDGCDDELKAESVELAGVEVSGFNATLANGCRGTWQLSIQAISSDTDLMTNADPANPTWYVQRTFSTTNAAACFPDGNVAGTCTDRFVATSTRE